MTRQAAMKWLKIGWVVLTLAGVAIALHSRWDDIKLYFATLPLLVILAAMLLSAAGKFAVVLQVGDSLEAAGWKFRLLDALKFYSYSDVAKYAPGGIWGLVSRIGFYRARGMQAQAIGRAFTLDHIWLIGGSLAIGAALYAPGVAALLGVSWLGWLETAWPAVSVFILAAWTVCLIVAQRFLAPASLSPRRIGAYLVKQLAVWALIGAGFAVLLTPQPFAQAYVPAAVGMGAFAIAFGAGFLAFFAPAGIGVREVAVIALLLPFYNLDVLLAANIANRVILFVTDLLFALCVVAADRAAGRRAALPINDSGSGPPAA